MAALRILFVFFLVRNVFCHDWKNETAENCAAHCFSQVEVRNIDNPFYIGACLSNDKQDCVKACKNVNPLMIKFCVLPEECIDIFDKEYKRGNDDGIKRKKLYRIQLMNVDELCEKMPIIAQCRARIFDEFKMFGIDSAINYLRNKALKNDTLFVKKAPTDCTVAVRRITDFFDQKQPFSSIQEYVGSAAILSVHIVFICSCIIYQLIYLL